MIRIAEWSGLRIYMLRAPADVGMRDQTADAETKARRESEERQTELEAAQKQEQRRSAQLALERGLALLDQGNGPGGNMNLGLLWVGRSMQLAPPDAEELHRERVGALGRGRPKRKSPAPAANRA